MVMMFLVATVSATIIQEGFAPLPYSILHITTSKASAQIVLHTVWLRERYRTIPLLQK